MYEILCTLVILGFFVCLCVFFINAFLKQKNTSLKNEIKEVVKNISSEIRDDLPKNIKPITEHFTNFKGLEKKISNQRQKRKYLRSNPNSTRFK